MLVKITGGEARYLKLLEDFWPEFDSGMQAADAVSVREIVDELDAELGPMLFPFKVCRLVFDQNGDAFSHCPCSSVVLQPLYAVGLTLLPAICWSAWGPSQQGSVSSAHGLHYICLSYRMNQVSNCQGLPLPHAHYNALPCFSAYLLKHWQQTMHMCLNKQMYHIVFSGPSLDSSGILA